MEQCLRKDMKDKTCTSDSPDRSAEEILDFITENDMINADDVLERMRQRERKELVSTCHPYKIWQAKDNRWKTHIADDTKENGRRLVARKTEKDLYDFLIDHYHLVSKADQLKKYTLRKLYPEWLDYKSLHTEASTYISRIDSDWKTYYLDTEIIDKPICQLDKLTLDTWAHQLIRDYDMTKTNYYNVTVIMRQALLYAVDRGIITKSPFSEVKVEAKLFRRVKKKPDEQQVFTKAEMKEIYRLAWQDFKDRVKVYELTPLAVMFQLQTGVRIGEVAAVKYSDLETPDYIHIQRMVRRDTRTVVEHPKTDCGDRYILLTSTAKALIEAARERQKELHAENEYIFSVDGLPPTERTIASLYTKYCKKMGITHKSSHTSRRTFISALIDAQVSINTVRATAGHASEQTTLGNYTFDRSVEQEKRDKFESALSVEDLEKEV